MAYCLLGLFDVNMPLLYGEGQKAFMRLQLEIIKQNDDESIFAWRSRNRYWRGLLAPWPDAFENSDSVVLTSKLPGERLPYAMTNKGLQFRLNMPRENLETARGNEHGRGQMLLTLVNCSVPADEGAPDRHIDIPIQESIRPLPYRGVDYWERVDNRQLDFHPLEWQFNQWALADYDHTRHRNTLDENNTTVIYFRQDGL